MKPGLRRVPALTIIMPSTTESSGEKRVIELLKKSSDPKELQDLILRELSLFTEGEEPFDDITFLVFRVD